MRATRRKGPKERTRTEPAAQFIVKETKGPNTMAAMPPPCADHHPQGLGES